MTVYYCEGRKVFATAVEPGYMRNIAGLVATLLFLAVFIGICVGVMGYVPVDHL
ncbi:hypothetical protein AB0E01_34805 [Nocardia vinacea]|uniref:hypothetical protein n=1 Tax=Nocardia vinacea TaxID=96468 RepID=UPI0033C4B781